MNAKNMILGETQFIIHFLISTGGSDEAKSAIIFGIDRIRKSLIWNLNIVSTIRRLFDNQIF